MKTGLTTSVVMHAALLGFGLFTLSAPSALEVADVEALPVDIVPIEEITQIQQGDKTATVKQPERKPAAAPATEVAPAAEPKQEVTPDPVAETIVAETAEAEAVK